MGAPWASNHPHQTSPRYPWACRCLPTRDSKSCGPRGFPWISPEHHWPAAQISTSDLTVAYHAKDIQSYHAKDIQSVLYQTANSRPRQRGLAKEFQQAARVRRLRRNQTYGWTLRSPVGYWSRSSAPPPTKDLTNNANLSNIQFENF